MKKFNGNTSMEDWVDAQQKLFGMWKDLVEEQNNIKVLEMFGDDCREAWNTNLKMQQEMFTLWQKSIDEFNPYNMAANLGSKNYSIWSDWWQVQERFLKKLESEFKNASQSYTPFSFTPYRFQENPSDATNKIYRNWLSMMNDTANFFSKQFSSSIIPEAVEKEATTSKSKNN